ncbi:MAG: bile acid:sodium symporter, partial [Bacteroidetes bacterium]|nr:bile acid:sodium symporter [Bacteroidota bacterium]
LIGILVTPLWIGLFLSNTSGNFDLSSIYLKLIVEIVLPVMLGLLLQKNYGKYAIQHSARLALFDKSIILLIIYRSFADAFANNIFSSVEIIELILVGIAVVILFFVMYFITGKLANIFGFHRADKITTQFCGTKKSLVHGTVFSKILFPVSFPTGIILLPLMLFHSFQIFVITIIATRLSKDKSSIE